MPKAMPTSTLRNINYCIKIGYQSRTEIPYYLTAHDESKIHQPHVYELAAFLAHRFLCTTIIDLGCGTAEKLAPLAKEFDIIGVDFGQNIAACRDRYEWGTWIEANIDQPYELPVEKHVLEKSLIICADVIEHLTHPEFLLSSLHSLLDSCPVALLSTPARDRVRGVDDTGPPANPYHVREWDLSELITLLRLQQFRIEHAGYTMNNTQDRGKTTSLVILTNHHQPRITRAPDDFRVIAIIAVHNEADVLAATIEHLIEQKIDAYILDNWSTDDSYEIASRFLGNGVYAVERYPSEKPSNNNRDWAQLLTRKEEISRELNADWFIHNDADEIFISPWAGINLRDALFYVQQCGFNAVDFTLVNFQPTDNDYDSGTSLDHFKYYEFGKRPAHFQLIRAWGKTHSINIASSGGHNARFEGRRVYPYKFIIKHYTFRTLQQAKTKISSRIARSELDRQQKGWSRHYLEYRDDQIIRNPSTLHLYSPDVFLKDMLVERLSGIGIRSDQQSELPRLNPPNAEVHTQQITNKIAQSSLPADPLASDYRAQLTRYMESLKEL